MVLSPYCIFIDQYAEVRQLETDRQALVYNHHHELVAASDTIRAVRFGVPGSKRPFDLSHR